MNATLNRILKAGWTVIKWTALAGGAVLLVLKAPIVACGVASMPATAWVTEKTKGDVYLTCLASFMTGMSMGFMILAVPEVAMVFTALGLIEMKKRWAKCITLRKAQERVAMAS